MTTVLEKGPMEVEAQTRRSPRWPSCGNVSTSLMFTRQWCWVVFFGIRRIHWLDLRPDLREPGGEFERRTHGNAFGPQGPLYPEPKTPCSRGPVLPTRKPYPAGRHSCRGRDQPQVKSPRALSPGRGKNHCCDLACRLLVRLHIPSRP